MSSSPAGAHAAEHSIVHHYFDDLEQQREATAMGMWSFLGTEVMMFGGLFFAYCLYRFKFHEAYTIGSGHLNIVLGTANTFVLLFSSLTMAMAVHAAQERKRKWLLIWLAVTWVLGAAFLGVKAIEWTADFHEGLVPALNWNPLLWEPAITDAVLANHVQLYFCLYFCMTGLHAIHMVIGLGLVGFFMVLGNKGSFTNGNDQPVELMGLYWHFVDIVWVFLFPLLYLIHGFHPFGGGH